MYYRYPIEIRVGNVTKCFPKTRHVLVPMIVLACSDMHGLPKVRPDTTSRTRLDCYRMLRHRILYTEYPQVQNLISNVSCLQLDLFWSFKYFFGRLKVPRHGLAVLKFSSAVRVNYVCGQRYILKTIYSPIITTKCNFFLYLRNTRVGGLQNWSGRFKIHKITYSQSLSYYNHFRLSKIIIIIIIIIIITPVRAVIPRAYEISSKLMRWIPSQTTVGQKNMWYSTTMFRVNFVLSSQNEIKTV
jgi:hypothetical protein